MSAHTRGILDAALAKAANGQVDRAALSGAAEGHIAVSPPLAELLAVYIAATQAWEDGSGSYAAMQAAADVMVPVRQAGAIMAGAFPNSPVIVSTGGG
jgi:hypothetical protein